MFRPKTLYDAYSLARLQEMTNSALAIGSKSSPAVQSRYNSSFARIPPPASTTSLPLLLTLPSVGASPKVNPRPTKTLTSKEIDAKRARGECFWFSEKFVLGHRCS